MTSRHAAFIAGHVRELDDAVAFAFGQAATFVMVDPAYSTSGVVTETTTEVPVFVDGPHDELDQYQGGEFAPAQTKTVIFYLPAKDLDDQPVKGDRLVLTDELGDLVVYAVTAVERLQVRGGAHAYRLRCGQVVLDG